MLAQPHGGAIALNPAAPAKDLKPAQAWFRIVAEGPLPADWRAPPGEARVTLQAQAAAQSLWRRWSDAAITALIQQTGL
jgi:putative peptide zinc metalloprotease protein